MTRPDARPARRHRVLRWTAFLLVVCVVAALVAAPYFVPWYVERKLIHGTAARYGLTARIDTLSVSLRQGEIAVRGLRVYDGGEMVLGADRVDLSVTRGTLLGGRVIVESGVVEGALVQVRVDAAGKTNFEEYAARDEDTPLENALEGAAAQVRRLDVRGGTVHVDDTPRETKLEFRDAEACLLDVQFGGRRDEDLFGQFRIDAVLVQQRRSAPVTVVSWQTPTGPEPTFVAHAAITGLDLREIAAYVREGERILGGADEIDLVVSMDVRDGEIRRGGAIGLVPGRTEPLVTAFGGRWDSPEFDASGSLAALFELPFTRFGAPGRVVWGTGSAVAGGAIGVVEKMIALDPVGAGEAAAGGVGGVVTSVREGVSDIAAVIGNLLGITGEHETTREVRRIHGAIRESFLLARRSAADRWSVEHGGAFVPFDAAARDWSTLAEGE